MSCHDNYYFNYYFSAGYVSLGHIKPKIFWKFGNVAININFSEAYIRDIGKILNNMIFPIGGNKDLCITKFTLNGPISKSIGHLKV